MRRYSANDDSECSLRFIAYVLLERFCRPHAQNSILADSFRRERNVWRCRLYVRRQDVRRYQPGQAHGRRSPDGTIRSFTIRLSKSLEYNRVVPVSTVKKKRALLAPPEKNSHRQTATQIHAAKNQSAESTVEERHQKSGSQQEKADRCGCSKRWSFETDHTFAAGFGVCPATEPGLG